MRLTEKVNNKNCNYDIKKGCLCNAFEKLGQLEDIEEELGVDLVIILKALKNGAWYIHNDGRHKYYEFEKKPYLKINWDKWCICFDYEHCYPISWYLDKENGWALTKEELL